MDLSFLAKNDREHFQRLFVVSGCSDLLEPKESAKILSNLTKTEFLEGCRHLNQKDLLVATKVRKNDELNECVQEAARHSNAQALSYFLDSRPELFNVSQKESGNLPLHTYLK